MIRIEIFFATCTLFSLVGCTQEYTNNDWSNNISNIELNVMYENFWNSMCPEWKYEHEVDPLIYDHFDYLGRIDINDSTCYHAVYYNYAFHTKSGGRNSEPRGSRGVQNALFFDKEFNYLGYSYDTFDSLKDYEIQKDKIILYCGKKAEVYFTETQVYELMNDNKNVIYDKNSK